MGGFGLDFPGIELAEGQPFVDDRPWLSASHPEALAPMAVALTRHAFGDDLAAALADRKSTRLNSSHLVISYAVFCLKKKIEQDLMQIVPREEWTLFSHLLIHHGREICQARKPKCSICPLLPQCPAGQKFMTTPEAR